MRMFPNNLSCAVLLAALFGASGCATVVKGTDDTVTVLTEPSGAVCELNREGETIGAINPTPGTIEVDRDSDDIVLTCDLEDHETTVARIEPEFNGMTVGNILLGGIIGVAVDAASGASYSYPDSITVVMMPNEFESESHRDEVYAKLQARIEDRFAKRIEDLENQCSDEELCDQRIARVEEERDKEIAELDEKRLRARVAGPQADPASDEPV